MKIYILLIICVAFWSGNFVLGRFIRLELDPLELAFFRWLGVTVLFLPQILKGYKSILQSLKNHFLYMIAVSFLSVTCFNTFLYVGLQSTTATNALLINSSIPILIILFSIIILKINISRLQISGVILSMIGVIFLALQGDFTNLLALKFNHGDIWVIASSLAWALYSTLVKLKPKDVTNFLPSTVLLGTIMLSIPFFANGYKIESIVSVSVNAKLVILYTILFASMASYYLWNLGIASIGADKTGQFTHLMPLFGILLAYFFLGEKLFLYQIFGFCLIGFGIWLSLFYAQKRR